MKTFMMKCLVYMLRAIYFLIKLLPKQEKIVMISRQSDFKTLDFSLLARRIYLADGNIKVVILTKKLKSGLIHKVEYVFHMLIQMYHIATSKGVLLDGYCIVASVLRHKKGTQIIQIWHALGAIKKFGYQVVGTKEGTDSEVARVMKMHHNYDEVICASMATATFFSEAFRVPIGKFRVLGMPRVDYIRDPKNRNRELINEYPQFCKKPTILYFPTFRKNAATDIESLINAVNTEKYNLIIRTHPLEQTTFDERFTVDRKYGTYDLLKFADYIITDYSSIAIEASILSKPTFFYVYDYDNYKQTQGLNIDPFIEMPSCTSMEASEIIQMIEKKTYNFKEVEKLCEKYVETMNFCNTEKIADEVIDLIQEE